ncbi:OsmC family protein [Streptomyces sp. NPDC005791]|uniref:OsmC family protein n=1 Tax=Streptomyces sp. NPDC005791 TaxID=3364732 RepID=UPI0036B9555D
MAAGQYGWAPQGRERLILGHESLGRVRQAPVGSGFEGGDLVVGVVRRPDLEPCGACAHGEFDMCRNGRYTERGIKERDGYASQSWSVEWDYAVKLDAGLERVGVLMEPTTVVAKAWEHSPAEYLLQALAGCYTVTLAALASAQGTELEAYRLELEVDIDLRGFLGVDLTVRPGLQQVRVRLHIDAPNTPREHLDELISLVESRSPLRNTLVSPVDVVTTLA